MRGLASGTFGFCTRHAVCATGENKEWMEVVVQPLHIKGIAKPFKDLKIVHVSDFHCSRTVSRKYLERCIQRINSLEPDIVLLTGDYITHDYYGRFRRKVSKLLTNLRSRYGIYACLGNHDYGVGGAFRVNKENELNALLESMRDAGIKVLRNEAGFVEIDNERLWFVGLGDLWADDFEPEKAFAGVDPQGRVIALSHNPEAVEHLLDYQVDAIVSGHTHGSSFEWTALPDRPLLNRRRYSAGMYHLGDRKLYVNRGLGRHGRWFNRRPEITVLNLS